MSKMISAHSILRVTVAAAGLMLLSSVGPSVADSCHADAAKEKPPACGACPTDKEAVRKKEPKAGCGTEVKGCCTKDKSCQADKSCGGEKPSRWKFWQWE